MSAAGVFQSLLTVDHPYLSLLFCRILMMMKSKSWLMQRAHRVQHRRHVHDASVQVKCYLVASKVHRWLLTQLLHKHTQVATSLCARLAMQQQQQLQSSDPLASTLRYDTTGSNCAVWATGSDCVVEG